MRVLDRLTALAVFALSTMSWFAHAVAGISLADGDLLRSKLKKCTSNEELRELENDFLRRAQKSLDTRDL